MSRVLILITLVISPLLVIAQTTFVLAVGIADYKSINDLQLAEKDACSVGTFMNDCGGETHLLVGSSATHENIITSLRSILAKAGPDDTVIFYFSGHGYEGGFCCWDMSTDSPAISNSNPQSSKLNKTEINKANRYFGGLSYAELQVLFRNCRAANKLVIADACYSGGLKNGYHLNASVQSARNGELIFILSSRPDETSLEMANGDNGLFTHFLLRGLGGEANANVDSVITLREIYDYVQHNVTEYASKIPHSQHPVIWGKYKDNTPILKIHK